MRFAPVVLAPEATRRSSRRCGGSFNPTGGWTTQQARNFQMHLQEESLPCEIVQRDQDTKYVASLDEVFRSTGCKIKKTCPRSPNLQAFVERAIQTLKHELLNAFCVVSERHLDHILHVAQDWYNHRRGHTEPGLCLRPPAIALKSSVRSLLRMLANFGRNRPLGPGRHGHLGRRSPRV